ncbi:MAG: flagella synthesis protein FlgN [Pseudohaliea sp.]
MLQSPRRLAGALDDLFRAQQERAEGLLAILRQEREALNSGDLAAIEETASTKISALAELEELKAREARLLAGLPFGDSDTPLEQALGWCDADGSLRVRCDQVIELMVACDRHNKRNGLLVQHRLNYVRRAIDVLHRAHAETLTYGPDGSPGGTRPSRLLAEG